MNLLLRLLLVLTLAAMGLAHAADDRNLTVQQSKTTEKRIALVIGNSAYPSAALRNPVNDAKDMAAALRRLGFDVIEKSNATQKEMNRAIAQFGEKLRADTVALFYYAGHGMQVRGKNYLIPIDAQIASEASARAETVDVDTVMDQLAVSPLNIVILDACRNNPFERRFRSVSGGLAQMDAPRGSLIAYATAPGKVAADGEGRNGLYTQELLRHIQTPGLPLEAVFKRVRNGVMQGSGEAQTPWEASSLTGDFYFRPGAGGAIPTAPVDTPSVEIAFWDSIKNSADSRDFQAYLDKYPDGQFIALAKHRAEQKPAKPAEKTPPVEAAKAPLSVFKDCAECPEMVVIPAGSFEMGSNSGDSNEKPVHTVRIGKAFAMGKTEVTQGQWKAVMGNNPSAKSCGDDCPVERVSWDGAKTFIQRLNAKTGKTYRLPSEAEWEYACRAGGTQTYCGSESVDSVAWYGSEGGGSVARYSSNSGYSPHSVAGKQANSWGLHDMSGNVWEWTEDCLNDSYNNAPSDGSAWTSGECWRRVLRGGSFWFNPQYARSAKRHSLSEDYADNNTGFRVARMLP